MPHGKISKPKLKSVYKRHRKDLKFKDNAEMMIAVNYILFIQQIAKNAQELCFEQRESVIQSHHIKQACQGFQNSV